MPVTTELPVDHTDVLVVGAGPAGLVCTVATHTVIRVCAYRLAADDGYLAGQVRC
jgi:ribulose 1,5-bisphosphate synthetase/thiazole synthase